MTLEKRSPLPLIGWREWLSLPDLGIDRIKAKIDTGARSSALYAFDIEIVKENHRDMVRFKVHPFQHNDNDTVEAKAELLENRQVKNSGGKAELRPVIITHVNLHGEEWPVELTLTHRRGMQFRMLLGREAIRNRFLVNPGHSYLQSDRSDAQATQCPSP